MMTGAEQDKIEGAFSPPTAVRANPSTRPDRTARRNLTRSLRADRQVSRADEPCKNVVMGVANAKERWW